MTDKREQKPVKKTIVTGAIILNKRGEILLLRRAETEDFFPGFWELPGGGKKENESIEECIRREVKEEVGIDTGFLNPAPPFTYRLNRGSYIEEATQINFIVSFPRRGKIHLSLEHSEYNWIKIEDLNNFKITANIRKTIKKALSGKLIMNL